MATITLKVKAARKTIVLNFKDEAAVALSALAVSVQEPNVTVARTGTTDGSGNVTLAVYPGTSNVLTVNDDRLTAPYKATLIVRSDGTYVIA